jgi:hypothetical protein
MNNIYDFRMLLKSECQRSDVENSGRVRNLGDNMNCYDRLSVNCLTIMRFTCDLPHEEAESLAQHQTDLLKIADGNFRFQLLGSEFMNLFWLFPDNQMDERRTDRYENSDS